MRRARLRALVASVVAAMALFVTASCTTSGVPALPGGFAEPSGRDSTVLLRQHLEQGYSQCTATAVRDGDTTKLVTAYHCVDASSRLEFYRRGEPLTASGHSARLVWADEESDLAVLAIDQPVDIPVVEIDCRIPAMGDILHHTHNGMASPPFTTSFGAMIGLELRASSIWVYAVIPLSPGSSGSGLIGRNGGLVGVTHGGFLKQSPPVGMFSSVHNLPKACNAERPSV